MVKWGDRSGATEKPLKKETVKLRGKDAPGSLDVSGTGQEEGAGRSEQGVRGLDGGLGN